MSVKSKKVPESVFNVHPREDNGITWTEWSDVELNNENWATPKNGTDGLFLDTQIVPMPPSLESYEWIRAKDLKNLTEPLIVFATSVEYPDFVTNNKHLLHSEFARWFISTLINLQYCGRDGLEISSENANFIWNGRHQSWQGWMNVYSMNRAGKGAHHRPVINPNGKYIVRLYFLGSWRRIVVDDMVPVNKEGKPLLPRTVNNSELWPMLLSKALLKLSSLTSSQRREIVDFHPIACLTGVSKTTGGRKRAKENVQTKKSKESARTKKSKENLEKLKLPSKLQPVTLFLGLEDMKELASEAVPGLSPCWSHFIYVAQSRDIPLDPKDVKPPLARWKLYRWLKWAIDRGLIDPAEYFVPIRCLKIVSPLKECKESILNMYSDRNEEDSTMFDQINQTKEGKVVRKNQPRTPNELQKKKEDLPLDISVWGDFNKMEPHIKDIHFFYKLEYFQYTAKISDSLFAKQFNNQKSEAKRDSRKSSPSRATSAKEPEFIDTYNWPRKMSRSRNEPLYLFCDSLEEKFFLVNFSTFQPSLQPSFVSIIENVDSAIVHSEEDYLTIEKHCWFHRPTKSDSLVSISTAGTKSTVLELGPGRHLLRIYCRSESRCFITISSDTIFHLGDRSTMHRLMSTESARIDQIVKHISNSVSDAYQSFGTERYPEALKAYYKSYMPVVRNMKRRDKALCNHIHEYFIDEEVQLIRAIFTADDVKNILRSLRIFFLNPAIGLERFDALSVMQKSLQQLKVYLESRKRRSTEVEAGKSIDETSIDYNRSAAIIQSLFKMNIIKKYKKIHDPGHDQHEQVLGNLLKLVELFDYTKRESLAYRLLRNIMKHHDRLYEMYPSSQDFQYVLQIQECKGTLTNVKSDQWLPIVRLTLNSRESETVFASFDLFINLPRYSLRVFNNETGREMLRVVNNVAPARYRYTRAGYTILAYGWSEDQRFKELDWTMNIITMKGEPMFHLLGDEAPLSSKTEIPTLVVEELSNTYIPNSKSCISKWIVRVTKRSFVSFRLRTSYELVEIRFRVTDEDGNVLTQVEGKSIIILPVVCLDIHREPSQMGFDETAHENNVGNNEHNVKDSVENQTFNSNIDKLAIARDSVNINKHGNTRHLVQSRISDVSTIKNGNVKDSLENRISDVSTRKNGSTRNSLESRIFYVEAVVLNKSWPLTKSEWAVVAEAKAKVTSSFARMKLSSASSGGKLSKSELLRTKKASKQSVDSNQFYESPFWVLQVVTDTGSGLEIFQDRTREKEIAQMKEAWAKENPASLQRGKELREAFISKHAIRPSSTSESNKSFASTERLSLKKDSDKTATIGSPLLSRENVELRTLKPPQTYPRVRPLDLSIYTLEEDEEEVPWVKTDDDEETLRNRRLSKIVHARENYSNFLEEMVHLLDNQKVKYLKLFQDHKDSFWERRARLNDVYEARKLCIASTKPVTVPSNTKSSTKDKKV